MRGKTISQTETAGAIASAVREKDWPAARLAMAVRLAEAADATDSARDLKSLARSLVPLLDLCELDQKERHDLEETPLGRILSQAAAEERDAGDLRAI